MDECVSKYISQLVLVFAEGPIPGKGGDYQCSAGAGLGEEYQTEHGSAMGSFDSDDISSPGAESLVEGQPPARRQRRRIGTKTSASGAVIMPHLPRIRVRPLNPVSAGVRIPLCYSHSNAVATG